MVSRWCETLETMQAKVRELTPADKPWKPLSEPYAAAVSLVEAAFRLLGPLSRVDGHDRAINALDEAVTSVVKTMSELNIAPAAETGCG